MSVAMDAKENHGGLHQAKQHGARQDNGGGLAQRSQNQLNQNHGQRRGRAAGKSRRRGAGYHNQKRHGMWNGGGLQHQMAWPRNARGHPQGVQWFPAPNANASYGNPHVMQPHRFPGQPATPSYGAENSMRYVYATPGTQLAAQISAMVSRIQNSYHRLQLAHSAGVDDSKCIHRGQIGETRCYSRQGRGVQSAETTGMDSRRMTTAGMSVGYQNEVT